MKTTDVRNWLGVYFLLTTVCLGAYILLFEETSLLPINKSDSMDAFQIIVPVFVAQLTTAFTWFTNVPATAKDTLIIPAWVVQAPPLLVVAVIAITIVSMVIAAGHGGAGWIDATKFKAVVTFCVTILNATTVLVSGRVFGKSASPSPQSPGTNEPAQANHDGLSRP
jgi:hypothetical protein